jgi:hypothetical protein
MERLRLLVDFDRPDDIDPKRPIREAEVMIRLVGVSVVKAKTMTGRLSLDSAGSPAQSGVPKTL